jgi:hypothetical protein
VFGNKQFSLIPFSICFYSIIVDIVLNHMVGVGQRKNSNNVGSSGPSDFDGTDGVEQFPGVPYGPNDFNDARCHGDIQGSDYQNNAANVRQKMGLHFDI